LPYQSPAPPTISLRKIQELFGYGFCGCTGSQKIVLIHQILKMLKRWMAISRSLIWLLVVLWRNTAENKLIM